MPTLVSLSRRQWLAVSAGSCLPLAPARASVDLLPRPAAPRIQLNDQRSQRVSLEEALRGNVTAVQLIFTGCSASCPLQGAQFAALAPALPAGVRLLSLSIDALGDDPRTLAGWMQRFGAHPAWHAAVPALMHVAPLVSYLSGKRGDGGTHDDRVFLFDRQARLAWRSEPSPGNRDIAARIVRLTSE
jgi:protein SCO1